MLQEMLDRLLASTWMVYNNCANSLINNVPDQLLGIEHVPQIDEPKGKLRYCYQIGADYKALAETYNLGPSGFKFYPPGGFLQWHTNSDMPAYRVYFSHVVEPGCQFRYVKRDGSLGIQEDIPGWNIRVFRVSKVDLFWHSVWCPVERYSFGFICQEVPQEFQQYLIER